MRAQLVRYPPHYTARVLDQTESEQQLSQKFEDLNRLPWETLRDLHQSGVELSEFLGLLDQQPFWMKAMLMKVLRLKYQLKPIGMEELIYLNKLSELF